MLATPPMLASMLLSLTACITLRDPMPPIADPTPPKTDPPPSRAVVHVVISQEGLRDLLDRYVPLTGEGQFTLAGQHRYAWERGSISGVRLDGTSGRIAAAAQVTGRADFGIQWQFPIDLTIEAVPVLSADYTAQLQAPTVTVSTLSWWQFLAQGYISGVIRDALWDLRIDLRPQVAALYERLAQRFAFKVGDATACVDLGVRGIEAGPTVLAGDVQKDLAVVLVPSVTMPCTATAGSSRTPPPPPLPPLHNVASLPSGTFSVVVPIAIAYAELRKVFGDGRLYPSKDNPGLYVERPEFYPSGGELVVKVHLAGFVKRGIKLSVSGDLYLKGHPEVRDSFLEVADLRYNLNTRNALLKLKDRMDSDSIRRELRQALRLDLSPWLAQLRQHLEQGLAGHMTSGAGCLRASVDHITVTNLYVHDTYMRLYVESTAQAAAYLPCSQDTPITMRKENVPK